MSFLKYFDTWYFLDYPVAVYLVLGYLHKVCNQKMSTRLDGFCDCDSVNNQDYVYDRVAAWGNNIHNESNYFLLHHMLSETDVNSC